MFGIVYVIMCIFTGYFICSMCISEFENLCQTDFTKGKMKLSNFFFVVPASYLVGTLTVTWFVYMAAYLISVTGVNSEEPLLLANTLSFFLFLSFDIFFLLKKKLKRVESNKIKTSELVFFGMLLLFVVYLMSGVFMVSNGVAYVGPTVFSDFAPHMGMIRSFSLGNNFPTMYPHFTGEDVRYHFMFQFLAGNLEYLGLRLDVAFNLPSILSFLSMMSLLYVLVLKIFYKRSIAFLTLLFVLFRPSLAVYDYLASIPRDVEFFRTVWNYDQFIGNTLHEDWGFYNLNVYCNQRHLSFAIGIMLMVILLMLPYLYEMNDKLGDKKLSFVQKIKRCFFSKTSFGIKDWKLATFLGILVGAIAFWNGSVLVATLIILFFVAAFSDFRLDFVILAGIALVLSLLQSNFFIEGQAVTPSFYFGYLAEPKTFFSVILFLLALCGPLVVGLIIYFLFERKNVRRYLSFVFVTPLIAVFMLSLTSDISVNHKWVIISMMLGSMFLSVGIEKIWSFRRLRFKVCSAFLILIIMMTGIIDLKVLLNRNENKLQYQIESDKNTWISENTDSKDIFLTDNYSLHEVVFGGAMLYYGWPYYAWSAGYDTYEREAKVNAMYGASDVETLKKLALEEGITYIIVENKNRVKETYVLREDIIAAAYEEVYTEGEGELKFSIYKVSN